MNKNDLRYVKTNQLIKDTFIDLVIKEGYRQTTITRICQTALISRNTFYLHYQTIDDLLDDLYLDLEKDFQKIKIDINHIMDNTKWYVNVINENKKMVLALLQYPSTNLSELLFNYVIKEPVSNKYENFDDLIEDPYIRLNLAYMLEAMISFTRCWLSQDQALTIDEVIEELATLCRYPTLEFLKKVEKKSRKMKT